MSFKQKFSTLKSVHKNFGVLEVFYLFGRKIVAPLKLLQNKDDFFIVSPPTKFDAHSFFLLLDSTNEKDPEEYKGSYLWNINASATETRSGFFGLEYDLGPTMSAVLTSLIDFSKPKLVLETGVAAGRSTALILQRLKLVTGGSLVSTDITDRVGELVSPDLRQNWRLEILPRFFAKKSFRALVSELGNIEIFVHDSNHDSDWQLMEVKSVIERSTSCKYIVIDDITPRVANWLANKPDLGKLVYVPEVNKLAAVFFVASRQI